MTETEFGDATIAALDTAFALGQPRTSDRWEPEFTDLFVGAVRTAARVVDAGAEYGFYTRLALLYGPQGVHIDALEPEPARHRALSRSLAAFPNVTVWPLAASDRVTDLTLVKPAPGISASLVGGMHAAGETFKARCTPLDDLVADADLVKLDLEGGEDAALMGMLRLLASPRLRTLCIELHPTDDDARERSMRVLRNFGYVVHFAHGDQNCGRAVFRKRA